MRQIVVADLGAPGHAVHAISEPGRLWITQRPPQNRIRPRAAAPRRTILASSTHPRLDPGRPTMIHRTVLLWLTATGGFLTGLAASPGTAQAAVLKEKPTRGEIAASAALDQLGVSFSWGGGSAKGPTIGIGRGAGTRGFDCSGLTLYAWSRAGVTLSHYTGTQFRQGRRIARGARRVGDLLFFGGGTGDPTHVALYLGRGLMIHAPKTGDVVKKTNFLTSPYYRTTFRGTVRPG
ncbi:NlpC/P60 family protein [Nonomuraea basaltis]|nr:NlpC/P60 family protein [Nonomuraea basaltis]